MVTVATPSAQTAYRVLALADAPQPKQGRGQKSMVVMVFNTLAPNTVAEFNPCPVKHYGRTCSGAGIVNAFAKRHGLRAKSWHINNTLYIAKLEWSNEQPEAQAPWPVGLPVGVTAPEEKGTT